MSTSPPGEALMWLFLDNADRGANAANDALVEELVRRRRAIQARANPSGPGHPGGRDDRSSARSTPGQLRPSVAVDPDDRTACPYRGDTCGVTTITDTPPTVPGWSCTECGTQWWISIVNLPVRRVFLDHLAAEVMARAALQEITTLAEHVDTLTDGQLRARLINCWARLAQACRHGFPAGYRLTNDVPGAPPVPPGTGTPR